MNNPIVSICCLTYNHAQFIRKALDGFLMQEPPTGVPAEEPWYEILIHDDCSTDGTTEIIKEYKTKYPDRIFPLYETENQYSKVGVGGMDLFNYRRARGKYIAYCEGDDYWTDPQKLQKQVDFMETHPDYSICFHACQVYDVRTGQLYYEAEKTPAEAVHGGADVTSDMFLLWQFGAQPLTMIMRRSMYDLSWFDTYNGYRDTHEIYNMLHQGKGYFMDFIGGVYNKHDGGVSASATYKQSRVYVRDCYGDLYQHNREDKVLRRCLVEALLWNYDTYRKERKIGNFHKMMLRYWQYMPDVAVVVYRKIITRSLKRIK